MEILLFARVFLMGFFPFCSAEIQHSEIWSDSPLFPSRGHLEIYVKDALYKAMKENDINLASMGFFLSTRDSWIHVLQDLEHG